MGLVDGGRGSEERHSRVAGDSDGDSGGKQARQAGERNQSTGLVGLRQESVDAVRQVEQHMGNNMPKGEQRTKRETISGGGSDVFRSRTAVSDGTDGAVYLAKSRRREERSGDGMRRVRRESGKGDATWSEMDATQRCH